MFWTKNTDISILIIMKNKAVFYLVVYKDIGYKMKIKVEILDIDRNFLNKISAIFMNKYSDKIEVYSFTDTEMALNNLEASKIDVFLVNDTTDIDFGRIPERCAFAFITENKEIDSIRGQRAIAKFQRADLYYKQILDLYSEKTSSITGFKQKDNSNLHIISFLSVGCGVGSSTLSAAFAKYAAKKGLKILYLNLERFGDSRSFFKGAGQSDFSDVIYAIKSRKSNIALKLESVVKQDESDVFFFDSPNMALDLMEFNEEELKTLLQQLRSGSSYDYIVIDTDFSFENKAVEIMNQSGRIVFVSDGTDLANTKLKRAYKALRAFEEQHELSISGKSVLVYNKFSSKISSVLDDLDLKCIGGIPKIDNASLQQIVKQLSLMEVFNGLMN